MRSWHRLDLRPDKEAPDWPKLLHLYSRLKPGVTIWEWMQEFDVEDLGIDVRRFISFGVVKVRMLRWLPYRLATKPHS